MSQQTTGPTVKNHRGAHQPAPPHHTSQDGAPEPAGNTDASQTTTRDTTETEAYHQANPTAEGEHATNQTTDESLRAQRSQNRR